MTSLAPEPSKPDGTSELDETVQTELLKFSATPDENRRVIIVSLFQLAVALFIGIPVWLKTTATYQAPLPFWEINSLSSRTIDICVGVNIVSLADAVGIAELASVDFLLQHSDSSDVRCGSALQSKRLQLRCKVRTRFIGAAPVLSQLATTSTTFDTFSKQLENLLYSNDTISQLSLCSTQDASICEKGSSAYNFILLAEDLRTHWPETLSSRAMLSRSGHRNLVFIFTPSDRIELAKYIGNLINTALLPVVDLQHLVTDNLGNITVQPHVEQKSLATVTTRLPPSSTYDMTVTILTQSSDAAPTAYNWTGQWLSDPTVWLQSHVGEAFDSWFPHVKFAFHSQRLHAVDIEQLVHSRLNANETYRYYTRDDLSNLVNHLESYLGAPQTASSRSKDLASTSPGLHLILFVAPSASQSKCPPPLRFHLPDAEFPDRKFVVSSVAVVPQWGGLFSVDAPCNSDTETFTGDLVGRQMVAVINSLLGLSDSRARLESTVKVLPGDHVAHWELDSWFIYRTAESLLSVRSTMNALVNLLARFPNMVINDFVADEVVHAIRVWSAVLDDLKSSDVSVGFGSAFTKAQDALASINSAFFDHTLLGRLYFQEDQKFGIYVPLFVPIGVALLMSMKNMFRILYPQ